MKRVLAALFSAAALPVALFCVASCTRSQPIASGTPAPASEAPATSDAPAQDDFKVLTESFGDVQILRYRIPGWEDLSLQEKEQLYYLYEAARAGRDIIWDQQNKHNLLVRHTLEAIQRGYTGDRNSDDFNALTTYTKQVWFARGIHHHYSSRKFVPTFSQEFFAAALEATPAETLPKLDGVKPASAKELVDILTPVIFDPAVSPVRVNRTDGADLVADSANNFYEGVTQKEVEDFYAERIDPKDPRPVSWGLNSKLVRENGNLVEKVWKVGGMYSPALEKVVYWLEKASAVAENPKQKKALDLLIAYYKSGDLRDFDAYNIAWVEDTDSRIDVINGFIETYGDAMGYRATWEAVVSIKDLERTKRIETIGANAQWFEDNSPIMPQHKKEKVVGISAKVITVVAEGGDAAPTTPVGINLPNSGWIRKEHGSKSVFLGNIVDAYEAASEASGVTEEFTFNEEELARAKKYGRQGYSLKVDMHEVIGHASGQLEEGVATPKETLKNYAAALEEARADLVALYYMMDPKLTEIGVSESEEVGKAGYDNYIRNGLLVQLARIEPGHDLVQSHMRNRQMVSKWAYEKGKADNVIEKVTQDGKIYYVIRDYAKLRELWGELLREVQRIKSQGDFEAGRKLIEEYGVKIDPEVHANVLERYSKLPVKPYSGFIQPELVPVMENGKITDVKVEYPTDFAEQQLRFSEKYSYLPIYN